MSEKAEGKVYLVGAGPGDPGLMTIRGRDCLARADVVVYDYLANPLFLTYASPGAERLYVGKKGGCHTMSQGEINALIIAKAKEGKTVVRLKGGDPFIFGRGGEEAEELVSAGVPFEIVPGVTSAIAVPAYAGIPLTHRDYTSTVAFVTGHEDPTKEGSDIAWDKLALGAGTIVFLMGVGHIDLIASQLTANGRPPETPVAVIRRGTLPEQKTVVGTLADIAGQVEELKLKPPAIIVVGGVVNLRGTLEWYEKRPLFGRKVVVTRAREQASEFLAILRELGAECIEFPTIEVVPPEAWEPLDAAIRSLDVYDWLLFTSVNGVRFFLERLAAAGKDVRDLKGIRIAAIGPKTARTWKDFGIEPDLVPVEYRAEAVIAAFGSRGVSGLRILLPRAEKAREILPEELRNMGAQVDLVPAYRTHRPTGAVDRVRELLERDEVDLVTFTSSSTVTHFLEMFDGVCGGESPPWLGRVRTGCIGPITAETARKKGFGVDLIPERYTIESFVQAIVAYFAAMPRR
ncbi:Uroporphyrinogen-III C-methyltransferase [uncultured Desulfatiglans sp.]|uniref:uroporphyrinogen-III C-methyltransferase n=1 Tax=Uncultured Desulfatiglans sp. TaxID=1748965 RepID=A0A653AGK9_UNCDX|nr:Uroporphyrinogen-III C-methyltransferase [uncultured Desulfatiglans sp.]